MNEAKAELGEKILLLKKQKRLSWAEIGQRAGLSPVFTCATCLGQMSLPSEAASKVAELLDLTAEETALLEAIPHRGTPPALPPSDPLIYRFHELVSVYGTTWKELIQEEFGDGIMSAIDFRMNLEREPDPKGDRVSITMSGKFLPYRPY